MADKNEVEQAVKQLVAVRNLLEKQFETVREKGWLWDGEPDTCALASIDEVIGQVENSVPDEDENNPKGTGEDGEHGKDDLQAFKVRCSREFVAYFNVWANNSDEAEEQAELRLGECEAESEASHIHDRYEVEEA